MFSNKLSFSGEEVLFPRLCQLTQQGARIVFASIHFATAKDCGPWSPRFRTTPFSYSDGILRIATNLLEVPAEIIAEIYRQRWTIELFFRFFKHVLGCRHLLSTSRQGVEIQAYNAIIACLLLALWTGGKPTLPTFEMVCLYLQGWANQEELFAHLKKLKPHTI